MAADLLGTMRVEIVGDNTKLDKSIKQSEKSTKKFGDNTAKLGASLGKLFAGIGFAVVAKKLFDLGKASERLFQIQEAQEAKLEATIRATGSAAGLTAEELKNMASELQGVTKFGDEATIGAQSLLLTFKSIGGDVFPRALESILDVSEAMGQDLKSSTVQIGKALNDPVAGLAALGRVGIQFSDVQKDLIKGFQESGDLASAQGVILEELEGQFGGVARAAAETAEGIQVQLNNSIGDLQEAIGESIANGMSPWRKSIQGVVEQFTELISKQNIAKDFIRDFSDGSIDSARSLDDLIITLAELEKQTEQAGRGGSQALKDQIEKVKELIFTERVRIEQTRDLTIQEKIAAAQALSDANMADKIAQDAIKRAVLQEEVQAELNKIQEASLTTDEKQIILLQEQIDKWAEFRDVPEAQELINSLVAQRNELMIAGVEILEETLTAEQEAADLRLSTALSFEEELKGRAERIAEAEEAAAEEAAEATERSEERKRAARQLTLDLVSSGLSVIDQLADNAAQAELDRLEAQGASEEEIDAKKKELAKANAKREKAIGVFDIGVNTASAIVKAFAQLGPIGGGIATAFISALGIAQTAAVLSTPLPKFAEGGIVPGTSFVGDNVPAMVNSKEAVLTQEQQAEFMRLANGGGRGGTTVVNAVIDKKVLFKVIFDGSKSGQAKFDARSMVNQ